jgi:lysophospholipase L1-like esterase
VGTFVALGDSLTEGVGDSHPDCPNGLRGWADLLAARLAAHDERIEYANLALRAKRSADVAAEQVGPAAAMRPDVVTLWAGGNDLLRPVLHRREVLDPLEDAAARLASVGAHVVLVTGPVPAASPALRLVRGRAVALDDGLRSVARRTGATLLDLSATGTWDDPVLWAPDRVHPSPLGHARLADAVALVVADALGLHWPEPPLRRSVGRPTEADGIRRWWREERVWWRDHAGPHLRRWVTRASAREEVRPKWPTPVRPAAAFGWWPGEGTTAHGGTGRA